MTHTHASIPLRTRAMAFIVLAIAAAVVQGSVVAWLLAFSRADDSASHLVIIPFVSAALVWYRRGEIFRTVTTQWIGGLVLILAGVALMLGASATPPTVGQQSVLTLRVAAVLVVWLGGFILLFGVSAAKEARFALAFLVFTLPIPVMLMDGATQILKRGSAAAVAGLFTLSATPYHREGFVFSLPRLAIEVADECSGIRSTIALFLTALLAGHAFLRSGWSKALLVVAILPVTLLKNGVRIVGLSLLATHVDPSFLVGRLHHDGGILFFLLAMALLLPVVALLRRRDAAPGVVALSPVTVDAKR